LPHSSDDAGTVLEARFLIAQVPAAVGDVDDALAELSTIRPLLADVYGDGAAHVRSLDKQTDRLRSGVPASPA
jgi:hypothetical protein